jgi:uncharacterized membrane protein YtjA (UPF0391 family)
MLRWAIGFLIVALVTTLSGAALAATATGAATFIVCVLQIVHLVSLLAHPQHGTALC